MPNLPNVLLVMSDQQKATASHLYDNSFCETPQMARLAQQGVLFEHAFTPHPLCAPARISLWTGQYPHAHGGRRNQTLMPAGVQHAARIWKQLGYHVGLIGKNHCFEHADDLALFDTWCEIGHGGISENCETQGMSWVRPVEAIREAHRLRREMRPQNPRFSYAVSDAPLQDQSTGLIAAQTVRFLEDRGSQPFALWVSFPDPHEPWVAPRRYAEMFPKERIELPPWRPGEFDDPRSPERNRVLARMVGVRNDDLDDVYGLMAVYYGMVRFLDDGLGIIMDALERLGLRENTIVIFCSDHGDFMGEHGMQCKGGVFYDCLTRVPLIVSWPGQIPEGVRDSSIVNLIDVVPTILQLQGHPIPGAMQGLPLPTVTEPTGFPPPRDVTFSEYGAGGPRFRMADLERLDRPFGRKTLLDTLQWREAEGRRKMVRTRDWKYIHDPMADKDELYDLVADPWELENVVDDPAHAQVLASMRMRLADWAITTEDARAVEMPVLEHYSL